MSEGDAVAAPSTPLNLSLNPSASSAGSVTSDIGSPMYFGSQQSNNSLWPWIAGGLALWLFIRRK